MTPAWSHIPTKSGLMLGLGETDLQVLRVLDDLTAMRCHIVTIGQYMRPTREHPEVHRYAEPRVFDELAKAGQARGIPRMFYALLVGRIYNTSEFIDK